MKLETVQNRLRLLTDDDRAELLTLLASDAVRMLSERVAGTAEELAEKEDALCAAAAAYAAYQLALLDEAQSPDSVTAGEVRAEFKTGSEKAQAYYRQCMRELSGILRDDAFYFGGVRT
ncbi:MAG: hypothetical protein ACI4GO_05480 [Hominenteromicrobium sp.]